MKRLSLVTDQRRWSQRRILLRIDSDDGSHFLLITESSMISTKAIEPSSPDHTKVLVVSSFCVADSAKAKPAADFFDGSF